MDTLPTDILIFKIFQLLSLTDLTRLNPVNKRFNQLLNSNQYWSHRFQLKYKTHISTKCRETYLTQLNSDWTKTIPVNSSSRHHPQEYGKIDINLVKDTLSSIVNRILLPLDYSTDFERHDFASLFLYSHDEHISTIAYDNGTIHIGIRYQHDHWKVVDCIKIDWRQSFITQAAFRAIMLFRGKYTKATSKTLNTKMLHFLNLY